jgi:hypothetical protein
MLRWEPRYRVAAIGPLAGSRFFYEIKKQMIAASFESSLRYCRKSAAKSAGFGDDGQLVPFAAVLRAAAEGDIEAACVVRA